jgi:lipooligosaccharide transport system ATP-binding protein
MDHGKIIEEGKPSDLVKKHVGEEVLEVAYDEKVMQLLRETFQGVRLEVVGDRIHVFTNQSRGVFAKMLGEVQFKEAVIRDANL